MPLLDGLAAHLAAEELDLGLTYRDDGTPYADDEVGLAVDQLPPAPAQVVALTGYNAGPEPDSLQSGADEHRVQFRARGDADPRTSRARLRAIFNVLQGLDGVTLPDGTYVVLAVALQADPVSIGVDGNGRHEHVQNYRFVIEAPTAHRQ
ncbi:minor capsid protein [Nocardiopsis sp. HUAS JQ3]|uniref:minor capsid protein n=1 Tax=Nocardiopsis sp. HUAS JQ3 TaxID=3061629 RepID=UPI0023A9FA6C|nr:minor capsid protein [Nocardiopsis sp. HUAS JQ3]WDZ91144.1 minor capsid protein [Nocardiopsis sp. HUAS JQ3]